MKDKEANVENYDFFTIDLNVLDQEWMNQPKLFFEYAKKAEKARLKLSEAEAELKLTEAEVDDEIRSNPEKYRIPESVTAASAVIKNRIVEHQKYKDALEDYNTARYQQGVLNAVVQALDQRKRALEKLVDLHGQNYFASPKASENMKSVVNEFEKQHTRNKTQKGRST